MHIGYIAATWPDLTLIWRFWSKFDLLMNWFDLKNLEFESLYSERFMDPYIQRRRWTTIFLTGSWVAIFGAVLGCLYFWSVYGSLYSDRSLDPYISDRSIDLYISTGPWIPKFWAVNWSLYSERSVDHYISDRSMDPYSNMFYFLTYTIDFP